MHSEDLGIVSKGDIVNYTSSSLISSIIRLIVGFPRRIVFALYLGVSGFGLIRTIGLLQDYSLYTNLGMHYCLTREIPIHLAKNEQEKIDIIDRTVFTWTICHTFLFISTLWLIFLTESIEIITIFTWNQILAISALIFLNRLISYLKTLAKGFGDFNLLSREQLLDSILSPIVLIPSVIFYLFDGFLYGMLIISFVRFTLFFFSLNKVNNFFSKFSFSLEDLKYCFNISYKLWIVSTLNGLFLTSILLFLALYGSIETLGLFAFSLATYSISMSLANPAKILFGRHALFESGKNNANMKLFKKYLGKPLTVFMTCMSFVLGLSYFLFSFVVEEFLEEFQASVNLMQVFFLGYFFYMLSMYPRTILNVANKQYLLIKIHAFFLLINILLCMYTIISYEVYNNLSWVFTVTIFLLAICLLYFSCIEVGLDPIIQSIKMVSIASILYFSIILISDLDFNIISYNLLGFKLDTLFLFISKLLLYSLINFIIFGLFYFKEQPITEIIKFLNDEILIKLVSKSNKP